VELVPESIGVLQRFVLRMLRAPDRETYKLAEAIGAMKIIWKQSEFDEVAGLGLQAAKELLMSECSETFDIAMGFIARYAKRVRRIDLSDVKARILAIANGEVPVAPKIRAEFVYHLAKVPKIEFPFNVIHFFLGTEENPNFQATAVTIVQKLLLRIEPDHLVALLSVILLSLKRSSDVAFVNACYSLALGVLELKSCPAQEMAELARLTMEGRLTIFNRTMPYGFDSIEIEYTSFLKAFVERFHS